MEDINTALAASKEATDQLIAACERTGPAWTASRAPGKWSPSRVRLETAHQKFDEACRQIATHGERMRTTIFGAVPMEDYVRFMELHTRHHGKQLPDRH